MAKEKSTVTMERAKKATGKKNKKKPGGKGTGKKAEPGDKRLKNEFWKIRKVHGKEKTFKTPEILWKKAVLYFEYVEENPLMEQKVFASAGELIKINVTKMRAMTLGGMFIFLNIGRKTWDLYREREDYMPVVERIELIIYEQKFTGASAGLLSAAIIVRELGLADKKEITLGIETLTDDQLDNQITDAEEKLSSGD
jgi:hypothetical protein